MGARFDPTKLDVAAFASAAATLEGEWPVAELPRLAASILQPPELGTPPIRWSVHGEQASLAGAGKRPALRLEAEATVGLECQRCLEPLRQPLLVDRRIFFVDGEDAAAALDLDSDDDVLALERSVDLRRLFEEELLLALPLIPRHATCPEPLVSNGAPAADASPGSSEGHADDHPFAGLAVLKARKQAD